MSRHGLSHPSVLARCLALLALLAPAAATALSLQVVDGAGNPVTGFRWLLEEDLTRWSTPGVRTPEALAYHLHPSHMPVVARGDDTTAADIPADPARRYYLSVLPTSGFSIGGAAIAPGQETARVVLVRQPIPTAQITVFTYEDNQPINNAADLPAETGLAGVSLILEEPGGRYGMAGGQVFQDAFGNPLGTTYQSDADGNPILDADGAPVVLQMGDGIILTDANGRATIRNLSPGKYGVVAVPPSEDWVQTSTIEGTRVIDAWVKANEPAYFQEFGTPGFHVEIGFVRPFIDRNRLTGGAAITGQVVNMHLSRPPDYAFYNGAPVEHTNCWVGLNEGGAVPGPGIYAQPCGEGGTFTIPDVPPGQYQLVVWDDNLDFIFALLGLTVPEGSAEVALGDVPVFQWFARLQNHVFNDVNENGQMDEGEIGLPEVPVNIRWRDGTMYQSFPTDLEGFVPFDEVFPFFAWLVAEVDFARYKATGVTVVVDDGGPIDATDPWSYGGHLNPQPQPDNFGMPWRTETGPVLTQGFQAFLGQTNVLMWGKAMYGPGENGGISGIVYYDSTRAEDDPQFATPEEWQPGIPRVQVNLYRDADGDGIPDDSDGVPGFTPPDVDNWPLGWQDDPTSLPGLEDVDRDGDGAFDLGDALQAVHTDSWDDNLPTGCVGDPADPFYLDGRCFDGLRNWNQVRPAVFDGGYAFSDIPAGIYIVESIPPRSAVGPTYQTVRAEDRNVDFGDVFVPAPMGLMAFALPQFPAAMCVGTPEAGTAPYVVGPRLTLFPDANIEPGLAGAEVYGCERKQVFLSEGTNGAADFFMFTEVPVAGHIVGFVLDDTANEFDPNAPTFGEKFAPPWLPISIRDWTGREISRVYSDEYGTYSALVPSTYTMDRPFPSGASPNMLTVCLNDPTRPDPSSPSGFTFDPYFNRQYSQFCYTFQYMPGTTTYLDTPVVRVAAFAGPDQYPLDCEPQDGEPRIYSVSSPLGGPYVAGAAASPNRILTIVSEGFDEVPNPAYDPALGTPALVLRDHGFGVEEGLITLTSRDGVTVDLGDVLTWTPDLIRVRVPTGVPTGNLRVTRANGRSTTEGVTVTVGGPAPLTVPPGGSIQAAIDAAPPNSTLFVPPGTYLEPLILWKPIRLQGWGAGSTVINAVKAPAEKLAVWRARVQGLLDQGAFSLVPGQEAGPDPAALEPILLFNEEGSGILVLALDAAPAAGGFGLRGGLPNARIDGFTITGGDHAGGITVNGYARQLQISNNRVVANAGVFGGGVRIGHPPVSTVIDAFNNGVSVVRNHIAQNGATDGAGGGVSIYAGADNYRVTQNFICGNFTLGEGAGIGHLGLSDGGLISQNTVLFNQSFNQGLTVSGGGILVSGAAVPAPGLTPGSGDVLVALNLVQGNLAGAGDGGGIRVSRTAGTDVALAPNDPEQWDHVELYANMIVNNVAALAGGGVSLQDAPRVTIGLNTISNNDSVATAGEAFAPGVPNASVPQPAGIVARAHTPALAAVFGEGAIVQPLRDFSNPTLRSNIVWENRSQFFMVDDSTYPARHLLIDRLEGTYWDLAVLGTLVPMALDPRFCLLTDPTGYHASNRTGDPLFVESYRNGARNAVVVPEVTTAIQPAPAFDEGGNFIDVRFGPLTTHDPATGLPFGDYHILPGSPAIRGGGPLTLYGADFDNEPRPAPAATRVDIGADELPQ